MGEEKKGRNKGAKFHMCRVVGTGLTMAAIALLLLGAFAQSASAAQVSVIPSYQEVSTGAFCTVDIYVDPEGKEIYGAQYWLHFNNSLLNATSQVNGTFLSHDGANTVIRSNEIDNTTGLVKYAEDRGGASDGVTIPGVLATITFEAIAEEEGVSELRFDLFWTKLTDIEPSTIYPNTSNGNVSVRVGKCGDVNNDGYITGGDATKVWDVACGVQLESILDNPWAADVNGDTFVTGGDATKIWDVACGVQPESILNC